MAVSNRDRATPVVGPADRRPLEDDIAQYEVVLLGLFTLKGKYGLTIKRAILFLNPSELTLAIRCRRKASAELSARRLSSLHR